MTEKIDMEPGIYEGLTFDQYRRIDAINHSTLKKFSQMSPYQFKYHLDNDSLFPETKALIDGRRIHESVLEQETFKEKYVHYPTKWEPYKEMLPAEMIKNLKKDPNRMFDGRTKECRLIKKLFEGKVKDHQEIIDYTDYYMYEQIRKSVHNNDAFQKLRDGAKFEVTLVWIDKETGLKCKGRLDLDSGENKRAYFCDLKSAKSANPVEFRKAMWKYNYNSAAAFYMDGAVALGHRPFKAAFWIVVEKKEPWYCHPFYVKANSNWIESGREWYKKWIEKLHYCQSTGDWHKYYDEDNKDFDMYEVPDIEILA